jgi:hypothetical protein
MVSEQISALAAIMIQSHSEKAEDIARKRAARCQRQLERDWAATWLAVADRIAKQKKELPAEPAAVS